MYKFDPCLLFSGPSYNNGPDSYGDGGRNVQKTGTPTDIGHTQRVSFWKCQEPTVVLVTYWAYEAIESDQLWVYADAFD